MLFDVFLVSLMLVSDPAPTTFREAFDQAKVGKRFSYVPTHDLNMKCLVEYQKVSDTQYKVVPKTTCPADAAISDKVFTAPGVK